MSTYMDPADFPQRKFDEDAFVARMRYAAFPAPERATDVPKDNFDEVIRAAFRQSNTVGALVGSKGVWADMFPQEGATPMAPSLMLEDLKANGLGHHANLFQDVYSREQYDARLHDLKQDLADRETLQGTGGFTAELLMGIVDPINIVPIAGGAAKVGAGAKAVARASAISAGGGALLSEGVMQATQPTRDWKEGALAVSAATIFGTGLGLGAHGLASMLGAKTARSVESTLDEKLVDLKSGAPKLQEDIRVVAEVQQTMLPTGTLNKELARLEKATDEINTIINLPNEKFAAEIASLTPEEQASLTKFRDKRLAEAKLPGASAENADGAFVARDPEATTSAGAKAVNEGRDRNVYTASDRADARLFGVLPVDKVFKGVSKLVRKVPYIGEAVGQGIRNPRLELQDAISPTAREILHRLDENPYITRNEASGRLQVDGVVFSEVYRGIEGGHGTAIKEINDVWASSGSAEFKGNRQEFGKRVYFAAINGAKDEGGSAAVERAAQAYKSRVFDPIQKLYQDAGLLMEGINVKGAESYTPWVHRAEAIINDKANFIKVHEEAFLEQLTKDFEDAMYVKGLHSMHVSREVFVIEAERNTKLGEIRHQYDGKAHAGLPQHVGKIAELQAERDELLGIRANKKLNTEGHPGRIKLDEEVAIAKARQARDDAIAGGKTKAGADRTYNAELRRIAADTSLKTEQAKMKYNGNDEMAGLIERTKAERDAKIKEAEEAAKAKIDELQELPSAINNELLKLKTDELRAERAKKLAKEYYDGATSGMDHLMLGESGRDKLLPSVLKARRSPILQKQAAENGWAETNIFDLAEIYHRGAGSAAAMATVFKKPVRVRNQTTNAMEDRLVADINLTEAIGQVKKDFQRAIDASGGGEIEVKLRQAMTETLKNIEIMRDGVLGRRETFGSKAMQDTADLAMQFNSWRLMGGTVLSSLTDPVNVVIAKGFGNTWRYGMVPALNNIKAYWGKVPAADEPAFMGQLRLAGAVLEREKNAFMGALMDLHNPSGTADKTQVFARNLSKKFWDYTGLTGWTQFWKNVDGGINHAIIIDASQKGWSKLTQSEKAWLANLRIDEDTLGRIKTMHDQQPQKFAAGIPYGHFEQWSDKHAASRFADALNREGKNSIIQPTVGDRLAFQSTAAGQIVGQFRSFGYANQARVVARNAALSNLDGHTGNMYGGMMLLGFMGAAVDAIKFMAGDSAIDGSSKRDPKKAPIDQLIKKWSETPGEMAYNALDRTSVFMPFTEPSNILQKLGMPNLQGAFSTVLRDKEGSRSGSSRFMHRSVGEAALGPSFGLLEDAAKLGSAGFGYSKYLMGLNENFKPTSSDFSRARRMVPFGNAPGIQQIINHGHQWMGSAYDWPKE